MLNQGDQAPDFSLPDADMHIVELKKYRGKKNVVVYFYVRDDTPGCTTQGIEFSELEKDFASLDTVVLGVSKDDCISHGSFRDKHGITVQLLADKELHACKAYAVWQEKEKDGVKRMGIVRSTFVIDKNGVIRHAMYAVQSKGHAQEVLELVKDMQ